MRKDHNLPTSSEILNHLYTINEHPERIKYFEPFILKEILIFIDKEIEQKIQKIHNQLLICSSENYPKEYLNGKEFDFWAERMHQFGFNYIGLKKLRELILKELNNPFEVSTKNYNRKIFENAESETFFNFIVKKWILDNKNIPTKISFLFYVMWDKNKKSDIKLINNNVFKIVSTIAEFAIYWNKKYPESKKLNEKKPNLKYFDGITNERYIREFNGLLDDFLKENKTVD